MHPFLQVLIGGGIGSVVRYGVGLLLPAANGMRFPWATFTVNLAGCFVIGLLAGLLMRDESSRAWWPLIFTGILGGFTTFSSFGLDTFMLWQNKQAALAVYYVLGTNVAGLLLVFAGYKILQA